MVLSWHTFFFSLSLFSDVYQVHLPLIDVYLLMDTCVFYLGSALAVTTFSVVVLFAVSFEIATRPSGIMDYLLYCWLLSYTWIQWEDQHFNFSCWFYILNLNEVMIVKWRYLWLWSTWTLDSVSQFVPISTFHHVRPIMEKCHNTCTACHRVRSSSAAEIQVLFISAR